MSTDQPAEPRPAPQERAAEAPRPQDAGQRHDHDPLRASRTSGAWIALLVFSLALLLLAVFILQNTQKVQVSFLGWDGRAPLAAAVLIAAASGALMVAAAGALRILQLRRRVKRERKA